MIREDQVHVLRRLQHGHSEPLFEKSIKEVWSHLAEGHEDYSLGFINYQLSNVHMN